MAHPTPSSKAFIVTRYFAGSSKTQTQRVFNRDRKHLVSFPAASMWLTRANTESEASCILPIACRAVYQNEKLFQELIDKKHEPWSLERRTFGIDAEYWPNLQGCMPCELNNHHLRERSQSFPKTERESSNYEVLASRGDKGSKTNRREPHSSPHRWIAVEFEHNRAE